MNKFLDEFDNMIYEGMLVRCIKGCLGRNSICTVTSISNTHNSFNGLNAAGLRNSTGDTETVTVDKFNDFFEALPHMTGFESLKDFHAQFRVGSEVECVNGSHKGNKSFYSVGQRFIIDKIFIDRFKIQPKGRGRFSAANFKLIGNQMKKIPTTKFYCIAEEKAHSKREYFDGEGDPKKAKTDAQEAARGRIRDGASGVVIMESVEVIRPKQEFDIQTFDKEV